MDEVHAHKNLFYISKMTRIAGLPQTASQRAFDMFLKVSHVQRVNGGGGVVFATGTPIANSVAEMFTMQRYLQMPALKALNIDHFDAWAATFGEPVTAMELSPDGAGYRLNTRFANYAAWGFDHSVFARRNVFRMRHNSWLLMIGSHDYIIHPIQSS